MVFTMKFKKTATALLLTAVLCVSMAACGTKEDTTAVAGTISDENKDADGYVYAHTIADWEDGTINRNGWLEANGKAIVEDGEWHKVRVNCRKPLSYEAGDYADAITDVEMRFESKVIDIDGDKKVIWYYVHSTNPAFGLNCAYMGDYATCFVDNWTGKFYWSGATIDTDYAILFNNFRDNYPVTYKIDNPDGDKIEIKVEQCHNISSYSNDITAEEANCILVGKLTVPDDFDETRMVYAVQSVDGTLINYLSMLPDENYTCIPLDYAESYPEEGQYYDMTYFRHVPTETEEN